MKMVFAFCFLFLIRFCHSDDFFYKDLYFSNSVTKTDNQQSDSDMVKPCQGILVQSYSEQHPAVDISGIKNRPLFSMGNGVIKRIFRSQRYGNAIEIKLDNGLELLYAHLENYQTDSGQLKQGKKVRSGERVGTMGTTGWSLGIHLHLEIRKDGKLIDPEPILLKLPHATQNL